MKRIVGKFILKKKINKYVKKIPIDERFKPLISDIILRRSVQYNRNYRELKEDLEAIVNNLERVRVVDREKMSIHNYAFAVYCGADKEILISSDTLKETPERIYQILAHEMFHVMLKNNSGVDKFEKFNEMLDMRSNLYQELIAEKGSYRLTYPVDMDYTGFNSNVFGYEDISFILDFIEAAYGVNEQDILTHSLNGRRELANFLATAGGEEIYEAEEFLDEMEVGGTLLLSTLYEDGDVSTKRQKSKDEVNENIIAAIESMFSICQSKIEERLRNAECNSVEELEEVKQEIAFSEYRLVNILKDRLKYFRKELGTDVDDLWEKCLGDYSEDVIIRLSDMEQLLADRNLRDLIKLNCINSVRGYTFNDEEFYKRFLVSRLGKSSFKIAKDFIESKKEPTIYTEGWKNKHIITTIKGIVEDERKIVYNYRQMTPRPAYEAQPSDKSGIEIYRINENQKKSYETEKNNICPAGKNNNHDEEEL